MKRVVFRQLPALGAALIALGSGLGPARAGDAGPANAAALARLLAAYPDVLDRIDGNDLVWRDGTRMPIDDGQAPPATEDDLDHASIKDMVSARYPAGAPLSEPQPGTEPGRARNEAFFVKLYGNCTKGAVSPHLVNVAWLPAHTAYRVKVTDLHGVADHVKAVSERLDKLPPQLRAFLIPPAGAYHCRTVAGTSRRSAHGYGIAIDIALKHAHYWRWSKPGPDGTLAYHNEIPLEIVAAFEAEGFIWGGRWHHYDTMHFEYRPELLPGAGGTR